MPNTFEKTPHQLGGTAERTVESYEPNNRSALFREEYFDSFPLPLDLDVLPQE